MARTCPGQANEASRKKHSQKHTHGVVQMTMCTTFRTLCCRGRVPCPGTSKASRQSIVAPGDTCNTQLKSAMYRLGCTDVEARRVVIQAALFRSEGSCPETHCALLRPSGALAQDGAQYCSSHTLTCVAFSCLKARRNTKRLRSWWKGLVTSRTLLQSLCTTCARLYSAFSRVEVLCSSTSQLRGGRLAPNAQACTHGRLACTEQHFLSHAMDMLMMNQPGLSGREAYD